jgi:hypothetical protein
MHTQEAPQATVSQPAIDLPATQPIDISSILASASASASASAPAT